jgi:hypothetical protein
MAEMGQLLASPATAGKPTTHLLVSRENYMVLQDGGRTGSDGRDTEEVPKIQKPVQTRH